MNFSKITLDYYAILYNNILIFKKKERFKK